MPNADLEAVEHQDATPDMFHDHHPEMPQHYQTDGVRVVTSMKESTDSRQELTCSTATQLRVLHRMLKHFTRQPFVPESNIEHAQSLCLIEG